MNQRTNTELCPNAGARLDPVVAAELIRRVLRTDLTQPGFVVLRLEPGVNSRMLRRTMVEVRRALHEVEQTRYLWLNRFDHQVPSQPHQAAEVAGIWASPEDRLSDAQPSWLPEYRIVYICDTSVTPAPVYRNLAAALGLSPAHHRDALWRQLKTTIEHLVDVVLDEAQHLPDSFFLDLAGFLNPNFDRRELLIVWLVGLPSLAARLGMRGREDFLAMIEHGLKVAGAKTKLLSEQAMELLWRVSHGLPRHANRLLRTSLMASAPSPRPSGSA